MDELNDRDIAELLLALKNDVPPAQILDHVPEHGEPVDRENEDHRHRGLLLSSLGPIVAMMGAGFIFIKQLFEQHGYKVETLFSKPTFGEFIVNLSAEQKQVFCANTAYYIDAMRHNKQLEVITEGGVQKLKPLSSSGSSAVTLTPSSTMRLHGNEVIQKNEENGKLVYKQDQTEILVPEDPIEISAFCMAHFFNTENVQILMNWGEDFKLISEEDLLRLLGQLRERDEWKQRIIGKIFESAYYIYDNTTPYLDYITTTGSSITNMIRTAPDDIRTTYEFNTEVVWPRYREQTLNRLARERPNLWAAGMNAINYPIPSAFFAFVVFYYLRNPIVAAGHIVYEVARFPYRILSWLTGRNPDRDGALAIERGHAGGAIKGGGNQQPLSVIVINNPLPQVYIDNLEKLFDEAGSIDSFVKHIDSEESLRIKGKSIFQLVSSAILGKRKGKSNVESIKRPKDVDPTSVTDFPFKGGKRKLTRRRTKLTKRKHQNKRKTHKR